MSEIESLKNRSPLGWLRERDIDLLICGELHAPGPLRDRFASLWTGRNAQFFGAWVSHMDISGESDLVVEFKDGKSSLILLIENKVKSPFQPEQAERYTERAACWRKQKNTEIITVLMCPREYALGADSDRFDEVIPYESLIETLESTADGRSEFLALNSGYSIE